MKRYPTTSEYKKWNKRRLLKLQRLLRLKNIELERIKRYKRKGKQIKSKKPNYIYEDLKNPVIAPSDLRLLQNTTECLEFFRDLRAEDYISRRGKVRFVVISLKGVEQIDYGTISVLTAIGDDLKFKGIILRSYLPDNADCKKFMIDSGYLNNLFDDNGKPFPKTPKSELIFFEKGRERLTEEETKKISLIIKKVMGHLTGVEKYCQPITTIILEVCGNSIEWSGTDSKQWLLGVKYDDDKVTFTVTDAGKGILEALYRRFSKRFFEAFKSSDEILKGAFDKKYGSTTREDNRNKGLPAVKSNFLNGRIQNLKVLTNNVILHFDNDSLSKEFERGSPRFKGTFYQWEMNSECIKNITNSA